MRFQYSAVLPFQNRATVWLAVSGAPGTPAMPKVLVSVKSAAYSAVPSAGGGGSRNCDALTSTHGVIVANCGPAPVAPAAVGRQKPTRSTPTNGGAGSGAKPSRARASKIVSATSCP